MADKKLALYINHGENFRLRDVYDQGQNADWKSGPAGIVVKASENHSCFPLRITKEELNMKGFVIVE